MGPGSIEEILLRLRSEGFEHVGDLVDKVGENLDAAGKKAIKTGTKFDATGKKIRKSLSISSELAIGSGYVLKGTRRYSTKGKGDLTATGESYRLVKQKEAKVKKAGLSEDEKAWKKTHMQTEVTTKGKTQTSISYWKDKQGKKHIESQRKLTKETGRFKMELLSVLFASQGLNSAFNGLLRPTLEVTGVFETFGQVLTVTMLPALTPLVDQFNTLMNYMLNMSPTSQTAVGSLVILGSVLTTILTPLAALSILASGFGLTLGGLALVIAEIALPFLVLIGLFTLFKYAYNNNLNGFKDKVDWVVSAVTNSVKWITAKFQGLVDWLGKLSWSDFSDGAKKILGGVAGFFGDLYTKGTKAITDLVEWAKTKLAELDKAISTTPIIGTVYKGVKGLVAGAVSVGTGIYGALIGGGFLSSPYTTKSGVVYEGIHRANGMYDMNSGSGGTNITYAPMINITANISNDIDVRHLADKLDTLMQERMRKYVRGT